MSPIYDLRCDCGFVESDKFLWNTQELPKCPDCNERLKISYTGSVMIKMKGEGGYPSRKKQVFNTTNRNHPPLEKAKNATTFGG